VDLNRRDLEIGPARAVAYGHWGRPLLVFPSELGKRWDWEGTGMIAALAPLVEAGRVKVYCVDGADDWSWRADDVPLEERARHLPPSVRAREPGFPPVVVSDIGEPREPHEGVLSLAHR